MKRIVLSLFLCFCYGIAFAEVSVQLESPRVQQGQTFRLVLTINGTQSNAAPDLTPLQKDFAIIGTESNVSYSIVNGHVSSTSEWTIILTAKRSGLLQIPAIPVGQDKTPPISIEITQGASKGSSPNSQLPITQPNSTQSSASQQQQDVILLTEVSVDEPYVNQQIIYTVKLFNSRRLIDANYQPPQVEDALFVPFGDGRRYQITSNGRLYAVEEQQFALFPQKSGDLKIKPPTFNALVYDVMPRRVSVQAEPTTLKVKPIPAQFQGRNWLPAKQVTLSESYDKGITSLPEGSTVVRTVNLEALAVPAQLLPALDFGSSDQFSIYPEKPTENNAFKQQDLVGKKTVQVTYLLNKAGKITIPALTVPWFNTQTGKEETSSLPEFTINVTPAAGASKASKSPDSLATTPSQHLMTTPKDDAMPKIASAAKPQTNLAWWLAGGFALAWLLTLAAWRWQRPKQATLGASKRQTLKQLHDACLNNKPSQARDALIKWGCLHWPKANLLNLIDLENLVENPNFKQQINLLSQALYHDVSSHNLWQGDLLWQCISSFKATVSAKKDKSNPLPPINRL